MAMIKCPECGKEISDLASSCPNCGFPIGFESTNNNNNLNYSTGNVYTYNTARDAQREKAKLKNSKLSTWAAICAFFTCTMPIGFILAIIDLKKKDETTKHTGSWFAIIFGSLLIVLLFIGGISGNGNDKTAMQNDIVQTNIDINSTKENTTNTDKETTDTDNEVANTGNEAVTTGNETTNNSDKYISITSTELIDAYNENQVKCKQKYDGELLKVTGKVESIGTDILGSTYVCLGHDTEFTFVGIQCFAKDDDTINQIAELKEGDLITVSGKGDCGSLSFSITDAEIVEILESPESNYVDENGEKIEDITTGQSNALKSAKSYLDFSAFSYAGLIEQLEYEQYTHEEAIFAADNCGADWNEQAVKKAKSYLEFSSFSKEGLIEQLEYEGFTHEQAVYGAESNGY